jgi:uncharacterized protein YegJ (DUF2314 family)
MQEAKRLRSDLIPDFTLRDASARTSMGQSGSTITLSQERDAKKPSSPTLEYLDLKGRGLDSVDKQKLLDVRGTLLITVDIPPKNFEKNFVAVNRYIGELARATSAYVSDDGTREFYSARSWIEARTGESADLLSVSKHVTVHAYRSGDYIRAVTVGMGKLGLPNISVSELAASETRPVGNLINALSQRLFEAPLKVSSGVAAFQIAHLRPTSARRTLNESLQSGATGKISVCLYDTKPQAGDDDNRQFEVGFDTSTGPDAHAKRYASLASTFGAAASEVIGARAGDAELLDASRRAREKIPKLKTEFNAGLRPGDRLLVKSPFRNDDGSREYMWFEVTRWSASGELRGVLMSEPRSIRALRAGQEVTMNEADFYDYLKSFADGRTEGNETGKILQSRVGNK